MSDDKQKQLDANDIDMTRRDFLRKSTSAVAGLAAMGLVPDIAGAQGAPKKVKSGSGKKGGARMPGNKHHVDNIAIIKKGMM